jgi:adenine-specific DNA-methyltransferase
MESNQERGTVHRTKEFDLLVRLLNTLFEMDQADLDFGIYRIMNKKRDEVNRFLEEDLLTQVNLAFSQYQADDINQYQTELDRIAREVINAGMDPKDSPKWNEIREKMESFGVNIQDLECDVYNHLFTFFSRYYIDGDFISKRRYKQDVYAIPYEGEETKFYFTNNDQYYIKNTESFRNYSFVTKSGKRVCFELIDAVIEQEDRKEKDEKTCRYMVYEEGEFIIKEKDKLVINFVYHPPKGGKKKPEKQSLLNEKSIQKILESKKMTKAWEKELLQSSPTNSNPGRTELERHLTKYTSRNQFDYFIHKNLAAFLNRELDFYIKNEIMHLDSIESESATKVEQYLSKIRVIRNVAHKIIQFLSQLENFQKRLWLKKKFVVETNYCFTLNRIPDELYEEIASNETQRKEWVRLFGIDKGDEYEGFSEPLTIEFLNNYRHLPVDTRYFEQNFVSKLLEHKDSLDEELDCIAMNCDNFHGLNLMNATFNSKISSIYIDPPFNTDNKDFLYKDSFRHSSWASMMDDRLRLSKQLLAPTASIFTHIDYHEAASLKMLLGQVFGHEKYVNEILWRRKQATSMGSKKLGITNDTIWWFSNSDKYTFNPEYSLDDSHTQQYIKERFVHTEEKTKRKYMKSPLVNSLYRENLRYNFHGVNHPPKGWLYSKERMEEMYANNELVMPENNEGRIYRKIYLDTYEGQLIQNIWIDIPIVNPMAKERIEGATTQKPAALLKRILKLSTNPSDGWILDYFAGSGTILEAVLDANKEDGGKRRTLLIEVGEHFKSIIVDQRVKKLAAERTLDGSLDCGFGVKYMRLESYEDTLYNLELNQTEQQKSLLVENDDLRGEYILSYMLDIESRSSQSLLNIDSFRKPDQYQLNVERNGQKELVNVDLVETFNWLLGLQVKQIQVIDKISVVKGYSSENGMVLIIWRNLDENNNDGLDKWFEKQGYNKSKQEYNRIYVNGDNNLENLRGKNQTWKVHLIEEEFMRLMFDVQDF